MKIFTSLGFIVALFAVSGLLSVAAGMPVSNGPSMTPVGDKSGRVGCLPGNGHALNQVTLEQYQMGYWSNPCVFIVRSPQEWDALMTTMQYSGNLTIIPPPPAPGVDWKNQSVIVASLGQLPTNGFSIDVVSVKRLQATAVLEIVIHLPDTDLLSPTMTSPYHMVAVEKAGMNNVEVCARNFVYGSSTPARGHPDLQFESYQPPGAEPPAVEETWGALKARYR